MVKWWCWSEQKTLPNGAPVHQEKRKDCLCCMFFVLFLIGWIVLGLASFSNGNPSSLIYGKDYKGNVCGYANTGMDLTLRKMVTFPRVTFDILESTASGGFDPTNPITTIDNLSLTGVCVPSCPSKGSFVCLYEAEDAIARITKNPTGVVVPEPLRTTTIMSCRSQPIPTPDCLLSNSNCYQLSLNTTSSFYRCLRASVVTTTTGLVCTDPGPLPPSQMSSCITAYKTVITNTAMPAQADYLADKFNSATAAVAKHYGDIYKTFTPVMLIGILFSLCFAFLIVALIKVAAAIGVWFIISTSLLVIFIVTIALFIKAGYINNALLQSTATLIGSNATIVQVPTFLQTSSKDLGSAYGTAGNVSMVFFVILLVLIVAMRQKIKVAVDIMQEASKCIDQIPFLILYPVVISIGVFLLTLWFTSVGMYLASTSNVKELQQFANLTSSANSQALATALGNALGGQGKNFTASLSSMSLGLVSQSYSSISIYLAIYHIFGFLWVNSFIQAIGMTTIAGAVSTYYWLRKKEEMPIFALRGAFRRTMKYGLGSLAFGSFFICIVQFFRMFLENFNRKVREIQSANPCADVVMKAIRCSMYVMEVCLKFVSKNAYIIVAICGSGFLTSAVTATQLIFHNKTQIATINVVAEMVLVLGKLLVTGTSTSILFFFLDATPAYQTGGVNELSSPAFPILVCALVSFFISQAFFYVYDMVMDTLMLCYCYDRVYIPTEHFYTEIMEDRVKSHHKELEVKKMWAVGNKEFVELTDKRDNVFTVGDEDEES